MNEYSVLVLYKNKILLSTSDYPLEQELWSFVCERGLFSKSPFESVKKELKHIAKLIITPEHNALHASPISNIYYIHLTDKQVNSIDRRDGLRLEFYGLSEIEKLKLSGKTSLILSEYKTLISEFMKA